MPLLSGKDHLVLPQTPIYKSHHQSGGTNDEDVSISNVTHEHMPRGGGNYLMKASLGYHKPHFDIHPSPIFEGPYHGIGPKSTLNLGVGDATHLGCDEDEAAAYPDHTHDLFLKTYG
jgi:hypothetical protein